jgi:carbonic anhydrase
MLKPDLKQFQLYVKNNLKFDVMSSIVVFFVALPLCLGIALASGAPLLSGILSGIIGGIIVGAISGSEISVSGPDAGLATVVLASITQLGSFENFLFALFLAGILQIIFGFLKAGFIANYIPSNVVQGLLCAIGILLVIKQMPVAIDLSLHAKIGPNLLELTNKFITNPIKFIDDITNTGAIIISIISFAVLIYFGKSKNKIIKKLPAPIVVVAIGILLDQFLLWLDYPLMQEFPNMVNLPNINGIHDFFMQFKSPNWSACFNNPDIYICAVIIAVVASLGNLLNLKASEKIDAQKRQSPLNRELIAQGIGNVVAGLVGGIPVTAVIIRTSVNIESGAKTKLSTILHGVLIILAVLLFPSIMNKIPLPSLAAILIYTGYRLNLLSIYRDIYAQGNARFLPFIATVLGIIVFDLLTGIILGLIVGLFYILKSNSVIKINVIKENYPNGDILRIILQEQLTFLHKSPLVETLAAIPKYSQLIIDARHAKYIDKEILELLKEFQLEIAPKKNIALNLTGFKECYEIQDNIGFINVTTYDVQAKLSPVDALTILREGNKRFMDDHRINRSNQLDIKYTENSQYPIAVILGCIDSRVPVETVFDMSLGDLFCVRIAGNVVNDDILASIEYACNVSGAKLIVVLGHTRCGAIKAACDGVKNGLITKLLAKIKPAINAETITKTKRNSKNVKYVENVTQLNIANTLHDILKRSKVLKSMVADSEIGITGAIYDVHTGKVEYKNYADELAQLGLKDIKQIIPK